MTFCEGSDRSSACPDAIQIKGSCCLFLSTCVRQPRSTQPPVAPAASPLQYVRRRNANALRERGHIEMIEPILAIITVKK